MINLGDEVRIKNNNLVGYVCDIYEGWCYIEVDPQKLNGIEPEYPDRLFKRKIEDLELIS